MAGRKLSVDVDVWEGLVVPVREVVVMEEVEDVDEDDVVETYRGRKFQQPLIETKQLRRLQSTVREK